MNSRYIKIEMICKNYNIKREWIDEVVELELLMVESNAPENTISEDQLFRLEKIINLNQDLGINLAGIEVIFNLLDRIEQLEHRLGR